MAKAKAAKVANIAKGKAAPKGAVPKPAGKTPAPAIPKIVPRRTFGGA